MRDARLLVVDYDAQLPSCGYQYLVSDIFCWKILLVFDELPLVFRIRYQCVMGALLWQNISGLASCNMNRSAILNLYY